MNGIRLERTGAPHVGKLALLVRPEHGAVDFPKVAVHLRRGVGLRQPALAALGSRLAAGGAEDRGTVEKIGAERGKESFEGRIA